MLKKTFLILSWALYDLANQFFALNVVSLYFVRWITLEKATPEIFYSAAFGISMFLTAILAPVLGVASDISGRHRFLLNIFTLISVFFTAVLGVPQNIFMALLFFALANFGCQMAIVFYNSLMVVVTPPNRLGLVSGFGRMLGYSGALLAIYLVKPIVLKSGYQAAFLPSGILFLLFALPCMLFIREKHTGQEIKLTGFLKKDKALEILKTLKATAKAREYPGLLDFLKAAFFGLGAVNVVILFMSVYATRVFGLNDSQIVNLIAFSTIFAILGSIFSGLLSDYIGYKRCLSFTFVLWAGCFFFGAFARTHSFYWLIGALVGLALGSVWAVARALAIRLVPEEKIGEMFGLFNPVGYLSSVAGAMFWGVILLFLSPLGETGYRIALFSLIIFVALGFVFILRLPKDPYKYGK